MCRHVMLPYLDITLNGNTHTEKYTIEQSIFYINPTYQ